jgi:hypothetical protein
MLYGGIFVLCGLQMLKRSSFATQFAEVSRLLMGKFLIAPQRPPCHLQNQFGRRVHHL